MRYSSGKCIQLIIEIRKMLLLKRRKRNKSALFLRISTSSLRVAKTIARILLPSLTIFSLKKITTNLLKDYPILTVLHFL
jgi:hypothetical protein